MVEVGKDLEVFLPQTPAQAALFGIGCSGPHPDGYCLSLRRKTPKPPWGTYAMLSPPCREKVFPDSERISCVSADAHYLLPCHWASLKRVCLCLLCTLPSDICTYWWVYPQVFSKLNDTTSLILSSYERCSRLFITFMALSWIFSSMSMSCLYWRDQN